MGAALFLTLSVGCDTEAGLCDLKCDCEGCSDREYDDCLFGYEDDERAADREGCLDRYDDLVYCQDDTGRCSGNDFETSCGHERERLKDCIDDKPDKGK
jgi:hypothetical protein